MLSAAAFDKLVSAWRPTLKRERDSLGLEVTVPIECSRFYSRLTLGAQLVASSLLIPYDFSKRLTVISHPA